MLFKVQLWGSHVTLTVLCGSKNVPQYSLFVIIIIIILKNVYL